MKILALSTSTPRGSAAVFDDDKALAVVAYANLQEHAERIFEVIDAALERAGIDRMAIKAVACDVGPGSFTGVRVGVASGKGIALALSVPLAGVISLEAMAAAAFGEGAASAEDVVLATIDAKKNELFVAAYTQDGKVILPPCHVPYGVAALSLPEERRRVIVVGEGAALIEPPVPHLARGPSFDLPDAAWIARLAVLRLATSGGSDSFDPATIEPLYVRAPDAKPLALSTKDDLR